MKNILKELYEYMVRSLFLTIVFIVLEVNKDFYELLFLGFFFIGVLKVINYIADKVLNYLLFKYIENKYNLSKEDSFELINKILNKEVKMLNIKALIMVAFLSIMVVDLLVSYLLVNNNLTDVNLILGTVIVYLVAMLSININFSKNNTYNVKTTYS